MNYRKLCSRLRKLLLNKEVHMKNYISINNKKIELTEEQVRQIIEAYNGQSVQLADIPAGETFKIGEHEFVVLEQSGDTTEVIRKDLLPEDTEFGGNNNYNCSYVDATCKAFAEDIAAIVGEDNLLWHTVDLTSDDGLKNYGTVERRASLITADMYRRYVEILDKFKPDRWWWLATAHSTKRHENSSWVKCVSQSGYVDNFNYYYYDNGVRPFCILKSTIFVSK